MSDSGVLTSQHYSNIVNPEQKSPNITDRETHAVTISRVSNPDLYEESESAYRDHCCGMGRSVSRSTFWGSLGFNFVAFVLPALYSTLSKLWVANIDSSYVVTTDIYTYIGTMVEVLNEGLPRTAWLIIGDKTTRTISSRISLSYTMICFQALGGLIMTVIFIGAAPSLAKSFVPAEVRDTSLTYVRLSAPAALSSTISTAVSACTRALDKPDVPLIISSTSFVANIILDFLIISKFHVGLFQPTILMQAGIRLACDMSSALIGLVYFISLGRRIVKANGNADEKTTPKLNALKEMCRPAVWTFTESLIRNVLYLWVVSQIISLGLDYGTAWGVFNTIRWGLIMVPVQALSTSTLTFVGHAWGRWRARAGATESRPRASWQDIKAIVRPAIVSTVIVLVFEVPICIFLSLWGMEKFAFYISNSEDVASIVKKMWQNIDWCYIFYAVSTQVAAVLLATIPRWYLYQSLGSNFLWMLPWAIVMTSADVSEEDAWTYYAIIFGGALVFDFFNVALVFALWAWRLMKGQMKLRRVYATL